MELGIWTQGTGRSGPADLESLMYLNLPEGEGRGRRARRSYFGNGRKEAGELMESI